MDKNLGLGKGLSVLMGEEEEVFRSISSGGEDDGEKILYVDVKFLEPSPYQPRTVFNDDSLIELIESIKEKGVLQPLLVRKNPRDFKKYEIIAGERRFRASMKAGLKEVPVIVKDFDDKSTLEVALIENLQREDLNPLEEARGYLRLLEEFRYTQEALAKVVGKSRSYVANMMRLLDLSDNVKTLLENKELTVGHARALLNSRNPDELAWKVIDGGLNVRQTEKLVLTEGGKQTREKKSKKKEETYKKDSDIMALETELSNVLKTQVSIKWSEKGGEVIIHYNTLDKLDMILQRLTFDGPVDE